MNNEPITFKTLHSPECNRVIFRGVWGSHAYGTSTPESDRDMIGVFVLEKKQYLALETPPIQVADEHSDIRYYSLRNYCELAARANPNILDSLFLPEDCRMTVTPYWQTLSANRSLFVSKLAARTYCDYALAQIKKAKGCNKRVRNPMPEEPPQAEDFCRFIPPHTGGMPGRPVSLQDAGIDLARCHAAAVEYSSELFRLYDYGVSARGVFRNGNLCMESIPKEDENTRFLGLLIFNRHAFEQAKVKHHQYWDWKCNRNEARWRSEETGELDYNAKNLMHTFRLLYSGLNIMRHGEPLVRVGATMRDELLVIRNGKFDYEELVTRAELLAQELDSLKKHSPLPEQADPERVDQLLLEITERWEADHA